MATQACESTRFKFLVFTAPCYSNGAVLLSYCICPSIRLSVCDVDDSWSHMLGYMEFYYTVN